MILSVHQPNFLPWIGFFHKIVHSDVFILLDTVQIPRGKSVANRNKIKTASGELELVVPLSFPKGSERICSYREVAIADAKWKDKCLRTITQSYSKAPFFEETIALLNSCFHEDSFYDMNYAFIQGVLKKFGINQKMKLLSELPEISGQNNEMILNICKLFGADVYLSGKGASSYNDQDSYKEAGIELVYQSYTPLEYKQPGNTFIPNLSLVDMLFNIGFEESFRMLSGTSSS